MTRRRNTPEVRRPKDRKKSSREVYTGARSFDAFIRQVVESEPGTMPDFKVKGGAGSNAGSSAGNTPDIVDTTERLLAGTDWSRLNPRLRRELMARLSETRSKLDETDEYVKDRVEEALRRLRQSLGETDRGDGRGGRSKGGKGRNRPKPPKKPKTPKPNLPPGTPDGNSGTPDRDTPGGGVPGGSAGGTVLPLPRPPAPDPWPSEPEPPTRNPEAPVASRTGYFVSVSRVGYYTETPPVSDEGVVVFDFDDIDGNPNADGFLRLRPGDTWVSGWYSGEILRGLNLDVAGDYRVNFLSNGDFSR